jgi:hypothetical protein
VKAFDKLATSRREELRFAYGVHSFVEGDSMHAAIHRGMRVVGADGRRVGRVIGIRDADLVVRSGFFHPTDYLAARDRVADVRGQKIYLTQTAADLERAPGREAVDLRRMPSRDRIGENRRAEAARREEVRAVQRLTDDGSGTGEGRDM